MKRSLLLLPTLALFVSSVPTPSEAVGLGIALVPVEPGVRLDFLAEPGATDPVLTVELVEDKRTQSTALAPGVPEWFRPEMLWLDYSLFTFRVIGETAEALEVVVDAERGRMLWLRRQSSVAFKPWAQFLVEDVTAFERVDPQSNPLRTAPAVNAPVVPHNGRDCLAVVEVRGAWARVRTSELCAYSGSDVEPVEDAWVLWHDEERLLIDYGMTC